MTKHEIEQAAKNVYPQCDGLRNIYNNADNDLKEEGFINGASFVNSKQPYTAEDMQEFADWISILYSIESELSEGKGKMVYYKNGDFNLKNVKTFNTKQLLKLWEESKNEKHT